MTQKNEPSLIDGLLIVGVMIIAALVIRGCAKQAHAQALPSPPHVFRIDQAPAFVRLPDGSLTELPIGSEFGAERWRYQLDARVTHVVGSASIFRDGYED